MTAVAIDKVRASRDRHQFHEAWLARRALALLLPHDGLCAIAVEGLSEEDEEGASASTVEIADATFYFGAGASLQRVVNSSTPDPGQSFGAVLQIYTGKASRDCVQGTARPGRMHFSW
ncbi:MAG: hypothetical protein AB7O44_19965 [Hyphomicrobiaceae bacterium]